MLDLIRGRQDRYPLHRSGIGKGSPAKARADAFGSRPG
jgi:hypothetical protein